MPHPANSSPRRVMVRGVTAMALLLVGLAGCGQKDYRYVSSSQYGNFFRLPVEWRYADVTASDRAGRPDGDQGGISSAWHVQFSNSAKISENDIAGTPRVYTLSNYYRETNSISKLPWRTAGHATGIAARCCRCRRTFRGASTK